MDRQGGLKGNALQTKTLPTADYLCCRVLEAISTRH